MNFFATPESSQKIIQSRNILTSFKALIVVCFRSLSNGLQRYDGFYFQPSNLYFFLKFFYSVFIKSLLSIFTQISLCFQSGGKDSDVLFILPSFLKKKKRTAFYPLRINSWNTLQVELSKLSNGSKGALGREISTANQTIFFRRKLNAPLFYRHLITFCLHKPIPEPYKPV